MEGNITIKRIWEDHSVGPDLWVGFQIDVWCTSGWARGYFDAHESIVEAFGKQIEDYTHAWEDGFSYSFPEISYPRIIFEVSPAAFNGHTQISVEVDISGRDELGMRCRMVVDTELGMLESFGKSIKYLAKAKTGSSRSLFPLKPVLWIPKDNECE